MMSMSLVLTVSFLGFFMRMMMLMVMVLMMIMSHMIQQGRYLLTFGNGTKRDQERNNGGYD